MWRAFGGSQVCPQRDCQHQENITRCGAQVQVRTTYTVTLLRTEHSHMYMCLSLPCDLINKVCTLMIPFYVSVSLLPSYFFILSFSFPCSASLFFLSLSLSSPSLPLFLLFPPLFSLPPFSSLPLFSSLFYPSPLPLSVLTETSRSVTELWPCTISRWPKRNRGGAPSWNHSGWTWQPRHARETEISYPTRKDSLW